MTDDLRYPIGRPELRAPLTPQERAARIETLATLPARLRAAVGGWSDARLDTPYREGGWTSRQVVHHLVDSHVNGYVRFKLGVTEDEPTIRAYEEQLWAELPEARTGDLELSLPILEALHRRWATFLRGLDGDQFGRRVVYSDGRRLTLDELLCIYSWHGDHHLAHIRSVAARQDG